MSTSLIAPRPMRVVVAPGSKAETYCRNHRTGVYPGPIRVPHAEAIAPGFRPRPALDLRDFGGHIISDLVYTNFFVGGAASWVPSDINNIDTHLSAAMSDVRLNNVLIQYYRGAPRSAASSGPRPFSPDRPRLPFPNRTSRTWSETSRRPGLLAGWIFGRSCSISCSHAVSS